MVPSAREHLRITILAWTTIEACLPTTSKHSTINKDLRPVPFPGGHCLMFDSANQRHWRPAIVRHDRLSSNFASRWIVPECCDELSMVAFAHPHSVNVHRMRAALRRLWSNVVQMSTRDDTFIACVWPVDPIQELAKSDAPVATCA
jgi:hypothetical protein